VLNHSENCQATSPRHSSIPNSEVFCDFDGTITYPDATDAVLETFALPTWREWEDRWVSGKITSQECLSRQVELIRTDRETLVRFAAGLPIDEGLVGLDRQCTEHGLPLIIVSDGLDLLIEAILRRHDLLHIPVFSNHLFWTESGIPSLSFPFSMPECRSLSGTCKCALTQISGNSSSQIIYIGDGQSDRCVSGNVRILFAKGTLRTWCESRGIPYQPFTTLTDVTQHIFSKEAFLS